MDNLTQKKGGLWVDGVRVADAYMMSLEQTWHRRGWVMGKDTFMTANEARKAIDPTQKFNMHIVPMGALMAVPGSEGTEYNVEATQWGLIARNPEEGEDGYFLFQKKPVRTGDMTWQDWVDMNENPDLPTVSRGYEVINPTDIADMITRKVLDEMGRPMRIHSHGYLGKGGRDGYFFTVSMGEWDAQYQERIGTAAREYFTMWITHYDIVRVYNTSVLAVCQNTLLWGESAATRSVKIEHHSGALARIEDGLSMVYGDSVTSRQMAQEAAMVLADKPMTQDDVQEVAESVFKMPTMPDRDRLTKSKWETRMGIYEKKVAQIEANRRFVAEAFVDNSLQERVGITTQTIGTAFGGWQPFTFLATHGGGFRTEDRKFVQMFGGELEDINRKSFDVIMKMKAPEYLEQMREIERA